MKSLLVTMLRRPCLVIILPSQVKTKVSPSNTNYEIYFPHFFAANKLGDALISTIALSPSPHCLLDVYRLSLVKDSPTAAGEVGRSITHCSLHYLGVVLVHVQYSNAQVLSRMVQYYAAIIHYICRSNESTQDTAGQTLNDWCCRMTAYLTSLLFFTCGRSANKFRSVNRKSANLRTYKISQISKTFAKGAIYRFGIICGPSLF